MVAAIECISADGRYLSLMRTGPMFWERVANTRLSMNTVVVARKGLRHLYALTTVKRVEITKSIRCTWLIESTESNLAGIPRRTNKLRD